MATWRSRIASWMDGERGSVGGMATRGVVIAAVTLTTVAVVLSTVKPLGDTYARAWTLFIRVSLLVFAIDYVLRVWTAPEDAALAKRGPAAARRAYMTSALGVIDLVALAPLIIAPFVAAGSEWLLVLRLISVLKITRHAPSLQLFITVIRNEKRVLLSALLAMTVNWVLVSAVIYALEHDAQPAAFSSLPQAMWWSIVTMATVGYGDIVPISPAGRVFGGLVMVLGIASVAVPAGILATGFANELRKRRSMISWQLVAKMPLFSHLEASRIAAIARLLKLDLVPPRHTIVLRGEPGDAMFFIVSGEVEVELEPRPLRLGPGQYFGEIALLEQVPRTATVMSVTECELLALSAADFGRLLAEVPALRESIREVAERRLAEEKLMPPR